MGLYIGIRILDMLEGVQANHESKSFMSTPVDVCLAYMVGYSGELWVWYRGVVLHARARQAWVSDSLP